MILRSVFAGLALIPATFGVCIAHPDSQGWDGPGWYISGGAQVAPTPDAAYILFNGPHEKRLVCAEIYDRLYSPIGMCRYLQAKPGPSQPAER
jgi:hypothetical protein